MAFGKAMVYAMDEDILLQKQTGHPHFFIEDFFDCLGGKLLIKGKGGVCDAEIKDTARLFIILQIRIQINEKL